MEATENTARQEKEMKRGDFNMTEAATAFGVEFLDESACRAWILKTLHGDAPARCPECGSILNEKAQDRFWSGSRVKCSCGKFFGALTGTVLSGCHLDYRSIMLLAVYLFFGAKADHIARKLGISAETVRLWRIKFRGIE